MLRVLRELEKFIHSIGVQGAINKWYVLLTAVYTFSLVTNIQNTFILVKKLIYSFWTENWKTVLIPDNI